MRVIPISRVHQTTGRTPDYYFVEAGKKAMCGELTLAINLLKRGLALQPTHYLCRFSLAILLFKHGLLVEATSIFHELSLVQPNDALPHYNLAVCLVQLGLPQPLSFD